MLTGYSNTLPRALRTARLAALGLLGVIAAVVLASPAYAAGGIVDHPASVTSFAQASDSGPEANLPFLFAVYILTWAGFFGYAFYMSRRQRDMRRDIDSLRQALEERQGKDASNS